MTTPRTPTRVRVHASAKVNLTLRVLGIREDGYHELRTTFQSLALHDTLTFTATPGPFTIETNDPTCPADASNLVWKAAARLWEADGRRGALPGVRVRLHKRVPAQAGLGGGSSDAAATLRALALLWQTRVPRARLVELARGLGADVAFFLDGGTMLGVERGDLLFPLVDAPKAWVVLARPDFGVGTGDAYAWWDADHRAEPGWMVGGSGRGVEGEFVNDLEPPVVARHPRIGGLVRKLRSLGAVRAAMSGSGSAVFGLFESRSAAAAAAQALASRTVTVWLTRTITRREYQDRAEVSILAR